MGWNLQGVTKSSHGMITTRKCAGEQDFAQMAGAIGWPCHRGGAIAVSYHSGKTQTRINCMVFYSPPYFAAVYNTYIDQRLKRYTAAVMKCYLLESKKPVFGLNDLAECTYNEYPEKAFGTKTKLVKLRGVGAFIRYGPGTEQPELNFAIPDGRVLFTTLPHSFPPPGPPRVTICLAVLFSSSESI